MSAIYQALETLSQSLSRLEEVAAERERAAKAPAPARKRGAQEDLFTAQVAANVSARDNALVARRLDGAIDSLERLIAAG